MVWDRDQPFVWDFHQTGERQVLVGVDDRHMPPHTFLTDALHRYMYLLTVLLAASIVVTVGFAVAGRADPECRGNSPKKICPKLNLASGATISGEVTISADVPETVVGIEFSLDDSLLAPEDTVA
ncbi:MAG: hypothetical protein ACRDNY_02205, partial [Gaiellaceae bacterium]